MDDQANQDLDTTVTENFAKQDVPVTRRVELQIPVAVFTAHRGYDWSKLPDFISRDEADSLFEKIMSVKTVYCEGELPVGDAFKGVLYTDGMYAFAFRLMTAEKWDQAKRNANYCACAFVSRDKFKEVDFERLLDMDYFKNPIANPAATLDYVDEDYTPPQNEECYSAVMRLVDGNRDGKWSLIGSVLSRFGCANIQWLFARIIRKGDIKDVSNFGNWDLGCLENYRKEMLPSKEFPSESISTTGEMSQYEEVPSFHPTDGEKLPLDVVPEHDNQHSQIYDCHIERSVDDTKLAEFAAANEEWEKYCNELRLQVDKLKRRIQRTEQQRDDALMQRDYARESLQVLQIRIKQESSQDKQYNLLHVTIAFIIGVILSAVILGVIQCLTNNGGNDTSRDGVRHTAAQSVEALQ